jgi:hypothetical protein
MDFSFVLIIPLAALISATTVIVMALVPRWKEQRSFRVSFGLSYLASALILQPWHGIALREVGFLFLGLALIFTWVVAGCLIGTAPAVLTVKTVRSIRGRLSRPAT